MVEKVAFAKAYPAPFIVIEGTDGSGVSTQTGMLTAALRTQDIKVFATKQPSDGPAGAMIRLALAKRLDQLSETTLSPQAMAQKWALFFAADRVDHYYHSIQPKTQQGITVVCDRYDLSSYAYQGTDLENLDWLWTVNSQIGRPHLTIFLKVRPGASIDRIQHRSWHLELFESEQKLLEVCESYNRAIQYLRAKGDQIVEIDGERPPEVVHAEILSVVQRQNGWSGVALPEM